MSIRHVAVVYDDRRARTTTGGCLLLRELGRGRACPAGQARSRPRREVRSNPERRRRAGVPAPAGLRPCRAWWVIDTHLEPWRGTSRRPRTSTAYFAAQRPGAEASGGRGRDRQLAAAGLRPGGPRDSTTCPTSTTCASSGTSFSGPRAELVALLRHHFPRNFVGRAYFEEMARAYSASPGRLQPSRSVTT